MNSFGLLRLSLLCVTAGALAAPNMAAVEVTSPYGYPQRYSSRVGMGLGVNCDNPADVPAHVSVVLHATYETKDDGLQSGEFVLSARVPPKHNGQFDQQFLFVEISKVHSVTIRKVKSELVDGKIWEA